MARSLISALTGILAISAPAAAQTESAAKRAPLVVPPGEIDVRALVERAGQYFDRSYSIEKVDAKVPHHNLALRLQNPLQLEAPACEALVSRIAYAHGLALVPGKGHHRWIWRSGPKAKDLIATPVEMSPSQVLSPTAPQVCVVTTVKIPRDTAKTLVGQVRPFFAFGPSSFGIDLADDETIKIIGVTSDVAGALRVLQIATQRQLFDGATDSSVVNALVTTARLADADRSKPVLEFPPGTHAVEQMIDKLAQLLGDNHLIAAGSIKGLEVKLEKRMQWTKDNALLRFQEVVSPVGLAMMPLAPEHGVFQWVDARGPRRSELQRRAMVMSPEAALALRETPFTVMTAVHLEHLGAQPAVSALRPRFFGGTRTVTLGTAGDQTVLVVGMAETVAEAIDELKLLEKR